MSSNLFDRNQSRKLKPSVFLAFYILIFYVVYVKFYPYDYFTLLAGICTLGFFLFFLFLSIKAKYFSPGYSEFKFRANQVEFNSWFRSKSYYYDKIHAYHIYHGEDLRNTLILITRRNPIFISLNGIKNWELLSLKLKKKIPKLEEYSIPRYESWLNSKINVRNWFFPVLMTVVVALFGLMEAPVQIIKGSALLEKGYKIKKLAEFEPAKFKLIRNVSLNDSRDRRFPISEGDQVEIAISWSASKVLQLTSQPFIYQFAYHSINGQELNSLQSIKKEYLKEIEFKLCFTLLVGGLIVLFFVMIAFAENSQNRKFHRSYIESLENGLNPII